MIKQQADSAQKELFSLHDLVINKHFDASSRMGVIDKFLDSVTEDDLMMMLQYLKKTRSWFKKAKEGERFTLFEDVVILAIIKINQSKLFEESIHYFLLMIRRTINKTFLELKNRMNELAKCDIQWIREAIKLDCDIVMDFNNWTKSSFTEALIKDRGVQIMIRTSVKERNVFFGILNIDRFLWMKKQASERKVDLTKKQRMLFSKEKTEQTDCEYNFVSRKEMLSRNSEKKEESKTKVSTPIKPINKILRQKKENDENVEERNEKVKEYEATPVTYEVREIKKLKNELRNILNLFYQSEKLRRRRVLEKTFEFHDCKAPVVTLLTAEQLLRESEEVLERQCLFDDDIDKIVELREALIQIGHHVNKQPDKNKIIEINESAKRMSKEKVQEFASSCPFKLVTKVERNQEKIRRKARELGIELKPEPKEVIII